MVTSEPLLDGLPGVFPEVLPGTSFGALLVGVFGAAELLIGGLMVAVLPELPFGLFAELPGLLVELLLGLFAELLGFVELLPELLFVSAPGRLTTPFPEELLEEPGEIYPGPIWDEELSERPGPIFSTSSSGSRITESCPGQVDAGIAKTESSVLPSAPAGIAIRILSVFGQNSFARSPVVPHKVTFTWVLQTSVGAVPFAKYSV